MCVCVCVVCIHVCVSIANPRIGAHKENNVQCVGLLLKHHDTFSLLGQIEHCSEVYRDNSCLQCTVDYTWCVLLYL